MPELTLGPTWHMAYYHLPREGSDGFEPGVEDDLFYAVFLYYPAEDPSDAPDYSIGVVEEGRCRAMAASASEQTKVSCSRRTQATCAGGGNSCVYTTAKSVGFTATFG